MCILKRKYSSQTSHIIIFAYMLELQNFLYPLYQFSSVEVILTGLIISKFIQIAEIFLEFDVARKFPKISYPLN